MISVLPIYEKSIKIPIPNKKNIFSNNNKNKNNEINIQNYSLTSDFFDPCNQSPPNDFIIKLQMRINSLLNKNTTSTANTNTSSNTNSIFNE